VAKRKEHRKRARKARRDSRNNTPPDQPEDNGEQLGGANARQVGGDHYHTRIQHWDFVVANNIPYLEAQILRYVVRWRRKGGLEDLEKATHYLDKLKEVARAEGFTLE
jgi:hypothetical protein